MMKKKKRTNGERSTVHCYCLLLACTIYSYVSILAMHRVSILCILFIQQVELHREWIMLRVLLDMSQ